MLVEDHPFCMTDIPDIDLIGQCNITSSYKEPRSSGNPEVGQTHLAIFILFHNIKNMGERILTGAHLCNGISAVDNDL